MDYPRPEIDNTVNYLEAAYLSSTFRASPQPSNPLKVVIAGAGACACYCTVFEVIRFLNLFSDSDD